MNIIKFPQKGRPAGKQATVPTPDLTRKSVKPTRVKIVLDKMVSFVWVTIVLVWPFVKWVLSIEIFFQMLRMIYHWNTPGVYAGWTFLLHFSVLVALTWFVDFYRPQGMKQR